MKTTGTVLVIGSSSIPGKCHYCVSFAAYIPIRFHQSYFSNARDKQPFRYTS